MIYDFSTSKKRKFFDDNYFISLYLEDENIGTFDNLHSLVKFLNIRPCVLYERLRNNQRVRYQGHLLDIVICEKENLDILEKRF